MGMGVWMWGDAAMLDGRVLSGYGAVGVILYDFVVYR